jgi:hypothetical protein
MSGTPGNSELTLEAQMAQDSPQVRIAYLLTVASFLMIIIGITAESFGRDRSGSITNLGSLLLLAMIYFVSVLMVLRHRRKAAVGIVDRSSKRMLLLCLGCLPVAVLAGWSMSGPLRASDMRAAILILFLAAPPFFLSGQLVVRLTFWDYKQQLLGMGDRNRLVGNFNTNERDDEFRIYDRGFYLGPPRDYPDVIGSGAFVSYKAIEYVALKRGLKVGLEAQSNILIGTDDLFSFHDLTMEPRKAEELFANLKRLAAHASFREEEHGKDDEQEQME